MNALFQVGVFCLVANAAWAAQVTIEGGPEGLGNSYQWTVTNDHSSPIIKVEFPHYRASLFLAPAGWSSSCTNLVAIGAKDEPGTCTSVADSPASGIAPGRSLSFRIQLASGTVKRGSGTAVVEFADSRRQEVVGVLIPVPESRMTRFMPLVGLGVVLSFLIILETIRSRRKRRRAAVG